MEINLVEENEALKEMLKANKVTIESLQLKLDDEQKRTKMLYDRLILKEDRIENYVTQVDHLKDEARRLEKERVRFLTSKKTFELINIRKEF